jgi:hypothetical protein
MLGTRRSLAAVLVAAMAMVGPLIAAGPASAVGSLDASHTVVTDHGTVAGFAAAAQTFTAGAAGNLVQVDLPLSYIGDPGGALLVDIRATSGGVPTGTALASGTVLTSQLVADSEVPTWVSIVLSTGVPSVVGTLYAIVLTPTATSDQENAFVIWGEIPGTYANGRLLATFDGTTWFGGSDLETDEQDMAFKTYVAPTCQVITGSRPGAVILNGGSWCVTNASIGGTVTVTPGTKVAISGSTIGGGINANAPADFSICASKVGGALAIADATGPVVIGTSACAGSVSIGGTTTLTRNHGGIRAQDSVFSGAVTVTNNTTSTGSNVVSHNTINASLTCTGNSPAASNGGVGNTVSGRRAGECAAPGF